MGKRRIMAISVISVLCVSLALPVFTSPSYGLSKRFIEEYRDFEDGLAEVNQFTKKLIKERGAVRPEEKLWVISDYISDPASGYTYNAKNASRMGVEFFKTKNGVCTSFAVLYTLMARAAGVEARLRGDKHQVCI